MELLRVKNRQDWRRWLEENYQSAREIWLVSPKKHTGQPKIAYNEAVEEALCFGWIDSQVKSIDGDHTAQRFSPRKDLRNYSQPNIERLRKLYHEDKLLPAVAQQVKDIIEQPFVFAPDIIAAIKANTAAWRYYQQCSPVYRRIRVAFIEAARSRPEEFQKRLRNFIEKCAQGKQIGYGGITIYY